MNHLVTYSKEIISNYVRVRLHETKIGEEVTCLNPDSDFKNELINNPSQYVLLGIPEDIGVRANFGKPGTNGAWHAVLDNFLNIQANQFFSGKDILLLGHIAVDDLMNKTQTLNPSNSDELEQLRRVTSELDERIVPVIRVIIECGKTPIIIGGGHNNAYSIIKGAALAINEPLNVINCDPHADFRPLEGRHSGNGFSYAYSEEYLKKYVVFALHESYNTANSLQAFNKLRENLFYTTYEDIFVRESIDFKTALLRSISFVKHNNCGLELDLDAINNVSSSAQTPCGISTLQARQFVYQCSYHLQPIYLHLPEGIPLPNDNTVSKLLTYLINDFIKGRNENTAQNF